MSGRGDRELDYGRRGGAPDYYRGGPPPPHLGDYYVGPPGYGGGGQGYGRDFRDNRGPPPPMGGRGRYIDNNRGPPPAAAAARPPNRRRPPPGVITFRSYEEEREWVEERRRKRLARPSKFDVLPSAENQTFMFPMNAASNAGDIMMAHEGIAVQQSMDMAQQVILAASNDPSTVPQQTRHARRLYVGNLPKFITEEQIHRVFRDAIQQALVLPTNGEKLPFYADEDPILSVYINHERRFCFLEFKSVELCSACMALDGLEVMPDQPPVKVKRPNDYNASVAPKPAMLPELDVSRLGIISPTVLDGPNKIFIGGLHYHMTESQVLELLQAFGKVKAFHLVKNEPDAATSKGYCFAEYADSRLTPTVVANLNGMDIGGGKTLTARLAGERHGTVAPILLPTNATLVPVPPIVQAQQLQQQAQLAGIGQPSLPPDRNIVNGYDVESLVDAALGKCPMPTGPTHFDSFGQPLTRILQVVPQPIAVPALTPQQQLAINSLPSIGVIPSMQPMSGLPPMNGMPSMMGMPPMNSLPPMNTLPPLLNNIPAIPTTVPALTPAQQAAVNALSMIPGLQGLLKTPTRILVLLNMVTDEDLSTEENHAALVDEIREECTKFGALLSIQVPRQAGGLVESSAVRKVFLEYSTAEDAMKADAELAGRQFGPSVVETNFFPESDFAEGQLR